MGEKKAGSVEEGKNSVPDVRAEFKVAILVIGPAGIRDRDLAADEVMGREWSVPIILMLRQG